MFAALLLPLLTAGDPVAGTRVGTGDDPPVQLWISNDRRFLAGDRAKVHVRAEDDGYLVVLHADPDGHLRVLFPLDPTDDHFVRGGKKYEVRGRGDREAFSVDVSSGRGTVYAAWSRAPFAFQGYVLGDHWDYRALAPDRLPREPETELTEIARRMAGGSFDYDILTYDVIERVVYADDYYDSRPYSRGHYGSYYDDPWCGSYFGNCSGISVGLFFGNPYRRYYHRPYYYGYYPAYHPFFYDPYYYRPYHYYPYHHYGYYRSYHYPRYRDFYSWRGYRDYARPYTPYRFRGRDGVFADHRDRNYGFRRAVNTVYNPPVTRLREPESSKPLRRLVDNRTVAGPVNRDESRRETVRREGSGGETGREARPVREREPRRNSVAERPEPAVNRRNVEARRARDPEPERERSIIPDARERRDRSVEEVRARPAVERRSVDREPVRVERPRDVEARPARPVETRREPARAEPRSYGGGDRSADRASGGGGRVERSAPPPSSSNDGGRRSSGGGRGDGGGGGRRR